MDIVEQLRSATVVVRKVDNTAYNYDSTLAKNAADEIERLREANLNLRKELWDSSWPTMRNPDRNPYNEGKE